MLHKNNFGDFLKKLRIEAGFAQQADLSKATNISQQTISRWESGKSVPKPTQIRKLGSIFNVDELLKAAGYTKTTQESLAILSFDKSFPFMSLTPDSFERFCCDLLSKLYPKASVHLWGGVGHKQDGIDIKVDHSDGSIHTYQCKRETEFGPQKVKETIEYQTIQADKKYILLARVASPQARQEANRHDGWDIWDQEDISRKIRLELCKQDQIRLVDTYFPGQRMALIGEAEPGIWRDSTTHFAPFMNPSMPLNHTLPLIGRQSESRRLYDACVKAYNNKEKSRFIIYLVGVAGIGKSRLLKHVIDEIEAEHRDIRVWFWDANSIITSKDLESLGQGRNLLVVDGCRKADALIPLFDFVFRNQNTRLIVATRFDEFDRLKSEAADVGIIGAMVEEIQLNSLREPETTKIALEILKLNHGNESMAQHIAKWTKDSPLVTVLSTHLALKENISFAQVRSHKDYISIIKSKFSKLLIGEIGLKMDQASIHKILKVLALVQPFDNQDDRLVECIARLERLESTTIKRLLRILVEAGVLWKYQNNDYRLSPEILSDFIVEDVCIGAEAKTTGYADTLYIELEKEAPRYISNLIYNLGRFEWTKNMNNTSEKVSILDDIWSKLDDTPEDITIVERVSYYQPQKSLNFVEKLIIGRFNKQRFENNASEESTNSDPEQVSVSEQSSQENTTKAFENEIKHLPIARRSIAIFDDLTPIVWSVAIHKDFLAASCDLLWEMSKHYDASSQSLSANYNHPINILKEIFSYKPDKTQDYLIIAVDWAIDLLETYNAKEYPFSPFDLLTEIMQTTGTTFESFGNSGTSKGFTIDHYEFVAPLRNEVIDAFLKTLVSSDAKKACDAAKFVSHCLTYGVREDCPWFKEAVRTLEKIKTLVIRRKISDCALIMLSREIAPLLHRESSAITDALNDIQTQIHKSIHNDKELYKSAAMMGEWDMLQSKDRTHPKAYGNIINSIFDKNTMDLDALYDLVDSKYSEISQIDKDLKNNFKRFFSALCETNLDFSKHCVQQALNPKANDSLWQFAWIPLSMLLHYDRSIGQKYAARLLKRRDPQQRELVSQAYGNLSMNEYLLDDVDNQSLIQLLNDSEESVISSGLIFIKNIAFRDCDYQQALDWLTRIRIDVSDEIIQEMFEIIRLTRSNYPSKASILRTKEQGQEKFPKIIFERLCEYLITLLRIPLGYNDGIEAFLMKTIALYPEVVLDLVLKRAEHAVKNKLFERKLFPSYQIITMQFLNRETNGVFPKDHMGKKNSKTPLSDLRKIPNINTAINQWVVTNNDGSNSYKNVKEFLQVKILGKPAFDKTADKLMSCNTEHIFKEARDYIKKILPNKGDNGWLTHDDADKSIKELYDIVEDAFLALNKLSLEESDFAYNKWIESSEIKKFEEEIRPLYELFKGYLKAYQRTLDHSIDCFNTQAIIIPCKRDDIPLKQRYAVQLFPSHSTLEEKRIPSRIKFCGNSEQYDGCIEFSDGVQQKIEVTVANKGREQGKLKEAMRQNGYAMHPMNDEYKMVLKCLDAIKNKLDNDKHRNKYTECWLLVVLNGWSLESFEAIESFLSFFKKALEKEKYTIDWTQIKSIIYYPGN